MTKDEALNLALEALENNRRTHYYCEDTWYSCPKHEDGCANEAEGDECNCGADKANQEIDNAITAIKQARSAPMQEPMAWVDVDENGTMYSLRYWSEPDNRNEVALYRAPPNVATPQSAPVQEPHKNLSEHITQATNGRVYVDPITGDVSIGTPVSQPVYTQEDLGRAFSKGFIEGEKMAILEAGLEKRKSAPVQSAERVEPVAWWNGKHGSPVFAFERDTPGIGLGNPDATPLYTTPPNVATPLVAQRQWVSLTDQEIGELYRRGWANNTDFARAIEAKLKAKNSL